MLHTYNDGSILKLMKARDLINIPIWKGQRILDKEHTEEIKLAVGSDVNVLDSGYSIIRYKEETTDGKIIISSYLIDGQHRASVIRDFYNSTICESDFNVTITEKTVESESDAIEYFNKINNVKAQQWKIDPNLLINNYISALEKVFNKNKKHLLIRTGKTARPYLSVDNLRVALSDNIIYLKNNNNDILKFVNLTVKYNSDIIRNFNLDMTQTSTKDFSIKERSVRANFTLAYDTKLKWVKTLLSEC